MGNPSDLDNARNVKRKASKCAVSTPEVTFLPVFGMFALNQVGVHVETQDIKTQKLACILCILFIGQCVKFVIWFWFPNVWADQHSGIEFTVKPCDCDAQNLMSNSTRAIRWPSDGSLCQLVHSCYQTPTVSCISGCCSTGDAFWNGWQRPTLDSLPVGATTVLRERDRMYRFLKAIHQITWPRGIKKITCEMKYHEISRLFGSWVSIFWNGNVEVEGVQPEFAAADSRVSWPRLWSYLKNWNHFKVSKSKICQKL